MPRKLMAATLILAALTAIAGPALASTHTAGQDHQVMVPAQWSDMEGGSGNTH